MRSCSRTRDIALLLLVCMLAPSDCTRISSSGEDGGLTDKALSRDNCHSAAMLLMNRNYKKFSDVLERNNVAVSDDGVITLPTLKNVIPFEGIQDPRAVLGNGGSGVASYEPKINDSVDGVDATITDLKSLLDILGVKELKVKGMAGGPDHAPGGSYYKPERTEGWIKVAEKRALALLKRLGLAGSPRISVEGDYGSKIGVEISVTSLMSISIMKRSDSIEEDCGPSGDVASPLSLRTDELTPDSLFSAAEAVFDRGNIGFTRKESIALEDRAFTDNIIPFKRCDGKPGMPKHVRLLQCVSEVAIDEHVDKAKEAMKDIADLAHITGVTSFTVTGYSRAKVTSDEERLAAQKLGAARARELVRLLKEVSGGTPLVKFSNKLYDDMTECMKSRSGEKCDSVSKFGKIAVEIHMETLTNPLALGS